MGDEAMNPEPVADAGGTAEHQMGDPTAPGYWRTPLGDRLYTKAELDRSVKAFVQHLLAQVESLKAERDDLQAEAGTQALTIRRLTQERELDITTAAIALATEREAKARLVEALRGALEDIAHRSMFSDKDAIVRHARSALQRTGGSDA